jgi:chromosome segregation ATPase
MMSMTDDELKGLFDALRQENAATRAENAAAHAETRDQLRAEMRATAADNRHQLAVAIEHFDQRFDLLAESIVTVDEKLDRKAASIEERMEHGFADTQAMIKFSHDQLATRVSALETSRRTLEENLAELQARVERLESSAH